MCSHTYLQLHLTACAGAYCYRATFACFTGWGTGGGPPGGMFNQAMPMSGGFDANMLLQSHLMQVSFFIFASQSSFDTRDFVIELVACITRRGCPACRLCQTCKVRTSLQLADQYLLLCLLCQHHTGVGYSCPQGHQHCLATLP